MHDGTQWLVEGRYGELTFDSNAVKEVWLILLALGTTLDVGHWHGPVLKGLAGSIIAAIASRTAAIDAAGNIVDSHGKVIEVATHVLMEEAFPTNSQQGT